MATAGLLLGTAVAASAAVPEGSVRYVSGHQPIIGKSQERSAVRPAGLSPKASEMTPAGKPVNTWTKLANLPNSVVHDVTFVSATVGYAAAELGQIWQTTDGGNHWTKILDRGFPYYYYGIYVSGQTIMASGFNDGGTLNGVLSKSKDGGATWKDTDLGQYNWADRIRFVRPLRHGLIMNGLGLAVPGPNTAWTSKHGKRWQMEVPDPNGGWFGDQFTLLKNKSAFASGITYCKSGNAGVTWNCAPPADSVFDGPTEFVDDKHGWTAGGEIGPDVVGWLHRTTDGGATWSGRVLNSPWPIRQVTFLDKKVGWAAGGNVYSNVGGIYYTADGGKNWVQDTDTGDEMGACDHQPIGDGSQTQLWCIGFHLDGTFSSNVYTTTVDTP